MPVSARNSAPAEHSPAPDTFHWCYCNGRIAYLLISVSVQDSIRDMAVTAVFRVPFQMVLMLLSAPDIICQRQHFQHDLVPVLPAVYKSSCFFQMSGICTVQPCPVLFSNVHALFVQAVGSMISNRCAISLKCLCFSHHRPLLRILHIHRMVHPENSLFRWLCRLQSSVHQALCQKNAVRPKGIRLRYRPFPS